MSGDHFIRWLRISDPAVRVVVITGSYTAADVELALTVAAHPAGRLRLPANISFLIADRKVYRRDAKGLEHNIVVRNTP